MLKFINLSACSQNLKESGAPLFLIPGRITDMNKIFNKKWFCNAQ
ncbi:MAG: hypothetical protein AB8E15_07360 [Bdellovibrionales bacterium]